MGSSLGNLGNAYNNLGQYEKAIDHLTRSLAIREEIGDRRGVAYSLGNLGNAYAASVSMRRPSTTSLARSPFRGIGNRRGVAFSLGNLGMAYDNLVSMTRPLTTTLARSPFKRRLAIGRAWPVSWATSASPTIALVST